MSLDRDYFHRRFQDVVYYGFIKLRRSTREIAQPYHNDLFEVASGLLRNPADLPHELMQRRYYVEALKSSQEYELSTEVEKILNDEDVSTDGFGQMFCVEVKTNLILSREQRCWCMKFIETKTGRELCVESNHTGQYNYQENYFSFIARNPSKLPTYKAGLKSWGLTNRTLYIFETKQVREIKEEIEKLVNIFGPRRATLPTISQRPAWPRPSTSSPERRSYSSSGSGSGHSARSIHNQMLIDSLENQNYDGGEPNEENDPFSGTRMENGRQRFFSESQAPHLVYGINNGNYINPAPEEERFQTATNSNYEPSEISASYHPQDASETTSSGHSISKITLDDDGYVVASSNVQQSYVSTTEVRINEEPRTADNENYLPGSHLTESECSSSPAGSFRARPKTSKSLPSPKKL
ncbi:Oidioi.mRNA.OKI2018_I69.chr1.g3070.t1.cds [Oikopleura dioica]|uniref:Oidioi.mRNA.OKI2018_I69.chr1.g3070.t1.cds n=1 Tax=Oikopleura dioica TaxID=34765 RepID=A0ABN7SZH6_OIKDI|nr:Oidioi.mRNA.OKI2018_I69.chr1.g3070.t1.cds [Oikopleura dioica]